MIGLSFSETYSLFAQKSLDQNIKTVYNINILRWGLYTMITYEPFFKTLHDKGITEYSLICKHGMSANTIHRMKHGMPISTKTLDLLCTMLDCDADGIIKHIKDTAK